MTLRLLACLLPALLCASLVLAVSSPDQCDVIWTSPSENSAGSMPLGNGVIGLNVWVEGDGDLLCYIARPDALDAYNRLLKLGRLRVHFDPNPFATNMPFRLELKLSEGAIYITAGNLGKQVRLRLWVDANRPVVWLEADSDKPIKLTATMEEWRTEREITNGTEASDSWYCAGTVPIFEHPVTVVERFPDAAVWYDRNETSTWQLGLRQQGLQGLIEKEQDPLLHRTFGGWLEGSGLVRTGPLTLTSKTPQSQFLLQLTTHQAQTPTSGAWVQQLTELASQTRSLEVQQAWEAHRAWWQAFWERSFIHITSISTDWQAKASAPTVPTELPLRFGADQYGGNLLHGTLSDVRLYNRTLSSDEFAAHAKGEYLASEAGLVAHWPLSDLSDGASPEATGTSFKALAQGDVTPVTVEGRQGLKLAGGFLEVADADTLDLSQTGTAECWVAPDIFDSAGSRLLDKCTTGGKAGWMLDTYPADSLRLILDNGTLTFPARLPLGQWSHVAAVWGPGVSALYVNGSRMAGNVPGQEEAACLLTRGYTLQRFIAGCSSRGELPPKFNGSLFTFDARYIDPGLDFNPDWRRWAGGDYWHQNTRLIYWPMLVAGDTDLMRPYFEMYRRALPLAMYREQQWYRCEGAFFPETMTFWGVFGMNDYGSNRCDLPVWLATNPFINLHWQGNLENALMLLDYWDFTQDTVYFKHTATPLLTQCLLHYEQRFGRDANGKLRIEPASALETRLDCVNPLPDVAGLHAVVPRILALPKSLAPPELQAVAERLLPLLPEIPVKQAGDQSVFEPAQEYGRLNNVENPELYTIFPYRLCTFATDDRQVGVTSFKQRRNQDNMGWHQSGEQAALLGLADEAGSIALAYAGCKNEASRFPAFWGPNYDWVPDQDHGSNLMLTLQHMLLQYEERKIYLLPAWPEEWDVEFRLHAPYGTAVEAKVASGRLTELKVTPETRRSDVIICGER